MAELYAALEAGNANTGGSYLERGRNAYFIRGEGRANSLQDVGSMVIKQAASGVPLLVRDVADVRFGHSVRYGAMTRNGEGETVGGIVLMLKGASSEQTIKGVKERVADINKPAARRPVHPALPRPHQARGHRHPHRGPEPA